jgi:hypothetical protein
MPKTQIVIDLANRIVSVYATQPDELDVILVDWNSEAIDPRSPNRIEMARRGRLHTAFVLDLPVLPLYELAGSDTERAIETAEEQGALTNREVLPC